MAVGRPWGWGRCSGSPQEGRGPVSPEHTAGTAVGVEASPASGLESHAREGSCRRVRRALAGNPQSAHHPQPSLCHFAFRSVCPHLFCEAPACPQPQTDTTGGTASWGEPLGRTAGLAGVQAHVGRSAGLWLVRELRTNFCAAEVDATPPTPPGAPWDSCREDGRGPSLPWLPAGECLPGGGGGGVLCARPSPLGSGCHASLRAQPTGTFPATADSGG